MFLVMAVLHKINRDCYENKRDTNKRKKDGVKAPFTQCSKIVRKQIHIKQKPQG
jgi:hypothetical protein